MWLLDLIPLVPPSLPGEPSRERSPEENLVGGVGLGLLPVAIFSLVLLTDVYEQFLFSALGLPLIAAAIVWVLGARLRLDSGPRLLIVLGSFIACFTAGGIAGLMVMFFNLFTFMG